MTKLADTEFARKLARAPRTSLAAQIAESERLLSAEHTPFFAQLMAMVDDVAAAARNQTEADRALVKRVASDIAGAGGLMGLADVAHVSAQLGQLCDEMSDAEWSWDAVALFAQTLSLLTKSNDSLPDADRVLLVERLTTVRATLKTRTARTPVTA